MIAFIGVPNVGKSSIIGALCGKPITAVSDKPQTTQTINQYCIIEGDYVVNLIDTPGINMKHTSGYIGKLSNMSNSTIYNEKITKYCILSVNKLYVLDKLQSMENLYLIVNKCDEVKLSSLLPVAEDIRNKYKNLKDVIFVSAKTGFNIDLLREQLFENHKEVINREELNNSFQISENLYTKLNMDEIVKHQCEEAIFRFMDQEIPYNIDVEVTKAQYIKHKHLMAAKVDLYVNRDKYKYMLLGKYKKTNDRIIKVIGIYVRRKLAAILKCKIDIKIMVYN